MDFTFPPSFAAGSAAAAGPAPQQMTAAMLNSFLISAVADRLADYFERGVRFDDLTELCIHLARGIDYALTNNVVPVVAHRLPSLVKQVYRQRNDTSLKLESAVTLLMISFKNACKNGWFPATDTAELISMTNELCSSFCMTGSVTTEVSNVLDIISMIIPRFYPHLRLCRLITSFEAKPGYECLMADIDIQRNIPPGEQILLLVAQKDNIETSSCLISPPQVSFLVNGTGVERRNIVSLDTGPQFPTNITKMLKYGTNIIQAVGHFSGSYIIAIVSMMKSHPGPPVLNDYAQAAVAAFASDSEIIEGPSRISLNCPVSFRRIKTPVKGHLCKHHQCFDYDNFMEMNSRKPSWRCPCCNQSVSFIDLRIDQKMVKILGKVGDKTGDVIISADGSWKIAEHNCSIDHLHDGNVECESNRSLYTQPNLVDLTMGEESEDGESDASMSYRKAKILDGSSNRFDNDACETEDRKPFKSDQSFPVIQISSEPLLTNCTAMVTQGASHQIVDDICPMTLLSTSASNGLSVSAASTATQRAGTLESLIPDFLLNPQITDVPPALDQEPIASNGASQPNFPLLNIPQGQQLAEKMQLQHPQARSSIISNETEMPRISRNVNRAPAAVQTQVTQASNFSQRTLANVLNSSSNILSGSPSASYQSLPSMTAIQDGFNTNRGHHDHQYFLNPASQRVTGLLAPTQVSTRAQPDQQRGTGAYRASAQLPDHLNPHYQMLSRLAQQTMNQWTRAPPLSRDSSIHIQQSSGNAANISMESLVNLHNQVPYARHAASRTGSSFPTASDGFRQTGLELLPNLNYGGPRFDGISDLPSERSWQPTGRMRGSVTGSAYSAALGYYLARPAGYVPPIVPSTSDPLSVQFANSINGQRTLT